MHEYRNDRDRGCGDALVDTANEGVFQVNEHRKAGVRASSKVMSGTISTIVQSTADSP